MEYRKIALRVLFASIAIAVAAGVAALFVSSQNYIIGRLIGTAIMTAVASGLLLIAIRFIESKTFRIVGFTLSALTMLIYLPLLIAIWIDYFGGRSLDEYLFSTAGLFVLVSVPLLIGTLCIAIEKMKNAGLAISFIWVLLALIWLFYIWKNNAKWDFPVFTFPVAAYSSLFGLLFVCNQKVRLFTGNAFAIVGMLATIHLVRNIDAFGSQYEVNEPILLTALITTSLAVCIGIWNVLHVRNPDASFKLLEWITVVLTAFALASLSSLIYCESLRLGVPDFIERFSVGFGILTCAAILGTVVGQSIKTAIFLRGNVVIDMQCPRCKREIQLHQGKNNCQFCQLQMKINFESPSCRKCGYDLKMNNSKRCPECGEPIMFESTLQ